MIATWLFARGATVERLEQIFGSTTVFGTFKTQYKLRAYNTLGIGLVLIWILSPLGSQAILRLLDTGNKSTPSDSTIHYFDSSSKSNASLFFAPQDWRTDSFVQIYQAALVAPNVTQNGPRDIWGNPKIPTIASLKSDPGSSSGWLDSNPGALYSSLVGMPIGNLSIVGDLRFTMPSSYYTLTCPEGPQARLSEEEIIWYEDQGYVLGTGQRVEGFGSQRFAEDPFANTSVADRFWSIGTFTPSQSPPYRVPSEPMSIYFQFQSVNSTSYTTYLTTLNCRLLFSNVESQMLCHGKSCEVISMRHATESVNASFATPLDDLDVADTFFDLFTFATGVYGIVTEFDKNSFFLQYLKYGFNPIGTPDFNATVNITAIPGDILAERLARLMNTLWLPSLSIESVTGNFPSDLGGVPGIMSSAASVFHSNEVFICAFPWFMVLLISAIVLFMIGLIGTYLKYFATVAPEIVNHISSFTRDNPNVQIPPGGSSLGGFKRARYLKKVIIKIGDSKPEAAVGHVVVISVEKGQSEESRRLLDKKRKYE